MHKYLSKIYPAFVSFLALIVFMSSFGQVFAVSISVDQTQLGARSWATASISGDGQTMVAASTGSSGVAKVLYTSNDAGVTWTQRISDTARNYNDVAVSRNGSILLAGGQITLSDRISGLLGSTDGGVNWTPFARFSNHYSWSSVALSADGSHMVAAGNNAVLGSTYFYISSDGGTTWATSTLGAAQWQTVAMSDDGSVILVTTLYDYMHVSMDYGATWATSTSAGQRQWYGADVSADGTKMVAAVGGDGVWTSSDSGATWVEQVDAGVAAWRSASMSADGMEIVVSSGGSSSYIKTSGDGGATWLTRTSLGQRVWNISDATSDGQTIIAAPNGSGSYVQLISVNSDVPVVSIASPVEDEVVSSGSWAPVVDWDVTEICQYQYDSGSLVTVTCSSNGSDIPEPALNGAHTLTAYSTNEGQTASSSVSFTYDDQIGPSVSINNPGSGLILLGGWGPYVNWGDSDICEYAYDADPFQEIDCSLNGSDIPVGSLGEHTLSARGTDVNGNATTEVSGSFTIIQSDYYWYSTGSTDWTDEDNWFADSNHTIPAGLVPSSGNQADAILIGAVAPTLDLDAEDYPDDIDSSGLTGSAGLSGITLTSSNGTSAAIDIVGNVTLSGSAVYGGNAEGDASFNDDSYNNGFVGGDATFNNSSYNNSEVDGSAFFNGSSYNNDRVYGDATFNTDYYGTIPEGGVFTIGDGFNWDGGISGTLYGSDSEEITLFIFQGESYNDGAVPSAVFNDDSGNEGDVEGDAVFNDYSYSSGGVISNAVFNDSSENYGSVSGDAVFNGDSANYGDLEAGAIFNDSSYNEGYVYFDITLVGDDSSTENGSVEGTFTRIYRSDMVTTRDFTDNSWIIIADGVEVDLSGATYDTEEEYNTFRTINGGSFIPELAPTLSIASPTASSSVEQGAWAPSVSWGNATTCSYSIDGLATSTVDCSLNGSDISVPLVGVRSLSLQASSDTGSSEVSASFTLVTDTVSEEVTPEPVPTRKPSGASSARRAANLASYASASLSVPSAGLQQPTVTIDRASLERLIRVLLGSSAPAGINIPEGPIAVPVGLSSCPDMEVGFLGECARMLQTYLNSNGFIVATSGPGSIGSETEVFGSATQGALVRFQVSKGITPAQGYFGPKTRAVIRN